MIILTLLIFLFSPPVSLDEVVQYLRTFLIGTGGMGWHGLAFGQLWFIFPFMLLVALSPLLNHAIKSMSKEEHKAVIIILAFLFVAIPTINAFTTTGFFFAIADTHTNLTYFVALYVVAAYIKKYDVSIAPLKGAGISALSGLTAFALVCIYSIYLVNSTNLPSGTYEQFLSNNTIFIFTGAVFLFLSFKSVALKNKGISFAGKLTYDAYLFHTVMLYLFAVYWPATTSIDMPFFDYTVTVLVEIVLVTLISLGYGLLRYGMDRALMKLAKMSGISTAGSWVASRLLYLGSRSGPSNK